MMRRVMRGAAALVGMLVLTACAGARFRESVAMPALAKVYAERVRPVVEKAPQAPDKVVLDAFQDDLDSGLLLRAPALMAAWRTILLPAYTASVARRLSAGEIGPGVAASMMETARLFGERLEELV